MMFHFMAELAAASLLGCQADGGSKSKSLLARVQLASLSAAFC